VSASEVPAEPAAVPAPGSATRRELAVARALDSARSRAENRVELFLDAARDLMNTNATDFTVQEVVERSGQSLRTFYQYFAGKYELLLALFEESVDGAAAHLATQVDDEDDPVERLRAFCVGYYRMCRTSAPGEPRTGPAPVLVEFAQQLLTSHPQEAANAFAPVVELLDRLLDEADAAGVLRPGLDRRRIVGVVLQATMFNSFASVISASPAGAGDEALFDLLLHGIAADDRKKGDAR
jgi:AcrR family transcriptional regulator